MLINSNPLLTAHGRAVEKKTVKNCLLGENCQGSRQFDIFFAWAVDKGAGIFSLSLYP